MIKIVNATPLGQSIIHLEFSDGACGDYDLAPLLSRDGTMVGPLKDPSYFARVFIDEGALAWPNGFDLSPDALYSGSRPQ